MIQDETGASVVTRGSTPGHAQTVRAKKPSMSRWDVFSAEAWSGLVPDLPEALLRRQPHFTEPGEILSRSWGRRGGSGMRPYREAFEEAGLKWDVPGEMLGWDAARAFSSAVSRRALPG